MTAFIVGTGRCGSRTIYEALRHADNLTVLFEPLSPRNVWLQRHDESTVIVDVRLWWQLALLAAEYPHAVFVHVKRNKVAVVRSLLANLLGRIRGPEQDFSINRGLHPVLYGLFKEHRGFACQPPEYYVGQLSLYYDAIVATIESVLSTCKRTVTIDIEHPDETFRRLWRMLDAEGDIDAALSEFETHHNASAGKKLLCNDDQKWWYELDEVERMLQFRRGRYGKIKQLQAWAPNRVLRRRKHRRLEARKRHE